MEKMESAGEFVTAPKYYWSCCFVCRKVASHDAPLKRCARCHCMFYCSKVTNDLFVCLYLCFFVLLSVFLSVSSAGKLQVMIIPSNGVQDVTVCSTAQRWLNNWFLCFIYIILFISLLSVFLSVSLSCLYCNSWCSPQKMCKMPLYVLLLKGNYWITDSLFVCLYLCFFVLLSVFLSVSLSCLCCKSWCSPQAMCKMPLYVLLLKGNFWITASLPVCLYLSFFTLLSIFLSASSAKKLQVMMLPSSDAQDVTACSTAQRFVCFISFTNWFLCLVVCLSICFFILSFLQIATHDSALKRYARCHCMFYCSKVIK